MEENKPTTQRISAPAQLQIKQEPDILHGELKTNVTVVQVKQESLEYSCTGSIVIFYNHRS